MLVRKSFYLFSIMITAASAALLIFMGKGIMNEMIGKNLCSQRSCLTSYQ